MTTKRDPDERGSDPPLRVRYQGAEIAVRGMQTVYIVGLVVVATIGARVLPPAFDAMHDLSKAMEGSAESLRGMASEVRDTRAGVGRVEERLGRIDADLGSLRAEVRAGCPSSKRSP